ncbi:peptidase M20D family protein [Candidatus Vecturithrix granuli]|uniref:Peptidase M20 domain-containing protein 2 n=1 Tax=Vecturithrix granuli TaxID=1499967 RepID=A0A081C6A6_VECG1|nr:peptidase M20D family protein [Candidatus Vecturithrix granuli]
MVCLSVVLLASGIGVFPAWGSSEEVIVAVDEAAANCKNIAQQIFEFKEPGREEFKSSQLLMEELRKLGYTVTGDLPVPADLVEGGISKTAFKAELQGKGDGPTITIMLEYDALSNGHSCGHNLISGSGMLAASALAKLMPNLPGKVMVIGTPDEERGSLGGGKVALLEGGHFEGSDIVLITHPGDEWSLDQRILAMKRAMFTFHGKAAHAAAAPEKGISAMDAVILTFNCSDMLREHVRQDVRIHGIVVKGGDKVNVVPELAQTEFAVRALDTSTMENAYERVVKCAQAGALGTGATLEFTPPRTVLKAPIEVPEFLTFVADAMKSVGVSEEEMGGKESFGSSDLGNVGNAFPTVNLSFKIAPKGTAGHSDEFREAAASEEGWKATILAGKVVALSAYELLTHPEKVASIKAKFDEVKAAEGK